MGLTQLVVALTAVLLKPHLGSLGFPFMKSITGLSLIYTQMFSVTELET